MANYLDPVYTGSDPDGIGSIWIWSTFLRGVYTGSDPELFAFTRDRIQNGSTILRTRIHLLLFGAMLNFWRAFLFTFTWKLFSLNMAAKTPKSKIFNWTDEETALLLKVIIDFKTFCSLPCWKHLEINFIQPRFLSVPVWIRSQPFTRDLFGIGSKRDHFRKRSHLGTDSRSKWDRIREVPCKRNN